MAQALHIVVAGLPSAELSCQDPNLKPEESTVNSEECKTQLILLQRRVQLPDLHRWAISL